MYYRQSPFYLELVAIMTCKSTVALLHDLEGICSSVFIRFFLPGSLDVIAEFGEVEVTLYLGGQPHALDNDLAGSVHYEGT